MKRQSWLVVALVLTILQAFEGVDSQCTTNSACANTCGLRGLNCCSCNGGTSLTQTCTCCPKAGSCCRQPTGSTVCCPSGSTCSPTGTCVMTVSGSSPSSYSHTYCSSRAATTLRITVDNVMELFIDGQPITVAHSHDWSVVKTVSLPYNTQVIAVKATDYGVVAGILASTTDNSMISNQGWKCTANHVPASNWMSTTYDDSAWPAAVVSYRNLNAPTWGTVNGISTSASWIWTGRRESGSAGYHPVAFCRYKCTACSASSPSGLSRRDLVDEEQEEAFEQLTQESENQENPEIPSASENEEQSPGFESQEAARSASVEDTKWWRT